MLISTFLKRYTIYTTVAVPIVQVYLIVLKKTDRGQHIMYFVTLRQSYGFFKKCAILLYIIKP